MSESQREKEGERTGREPLFSTCEVDVHGRQGVGKGGMTHLLRTLSAVFSVSVSQRQLGVSFFFFLFDYSARK